MIKVWSALAAAIATLAPAIAIGQFTLPRHPPVAQPSAGCGNFNYEKAALGPLDYRITPPDEIEFVEVRHFPAHVERLVRGEKGTIGGDIAYTLRVFPNHPRALRSAAEWQRRNNGLLPPDMQFTIACWFDRAVAYRPDDAQVRIVWAFELIKAKQNAAALEQVTQAEKLAKGNAQIHYNVGLLYFDLKDYEKSLANARIAYEQGFNLPGLKDKLTKAGKWKE
jgi:tetratricopeptide (TPR) repeat protein